MDICDAASAKQVQGTSQLDKVFSISEKLSQPLLRSVGWKELCLFQPIQSLATQLLYTL